MSRDAAISVRAATKRFGSLIAVDRLEWEVPEGSFVGLLGPNGAGKTTLISMLAGLVRPTAGALFVHGYDVERNYRQARRLLGVVPQELVFDPFFTVRETLFFQAGYYGVRPSSAWLDELLERLALADKADVNVRLLSGGMKRRLMVAQALVHKPSVIVLDEPTAGVDVCLRQSLWAFMRALHQEGHTIVLTTHYLEEAEALCSKVAIMNQGRLVAEGSLSDLLQQRKAESLEALLLGVMRCVDAV